ncbi:hypothetical protein [Nonomuraea roseoviolacea]|uniref:Uncharacterized protein n=1 Tax=Nonomuraea roseoviolacea subsp. carminata TaxID=160689 RepID=A0ABT1JVA5_9ACTN|nr:hypothetical protein [Nonomuraea roseoviolacea]MCP2345342.1 hypothetical protein [Nonomuraea roseoviolacea subsp. carminata]
MLVISLGLAWLVLGPFSLWVLVSGRVWARAGAVMTLTLLEVATIATNAARVPAPHDAPVAASQRTRAECAAREPVPQAGRVEGRRGGLVLSWPATAGECATADVVLRADGRRLTVWLHEGPAPGAALPGVPEGSPADQRGATTVPVRVEEGRASLRVPLAGAAGGHVRSAGVARHGHTGRYVLIDGRSGHRIPAQAVPAGAPGTAHRRAT